MANNGVRHGVSRSQKIIEPFSIMGDVPGFNVNFCQSHHAKVMLLLRRLRVWLRGLRTMAEVLSIC